ILSLEATVTSARPVVLNAYNADDSLLGCAYSPWVLNPPPCGDRFDASNGEPNINGVQTYTIMYSIRAPFFGGFQYDSGGLVNFHDSYRDYLFNESAPLDTFTLDDIRIVSEVPEPT